MPGNKKDLSELFEEPSSGSDNLHINATFASRYEAKKRREELSKRKIIFMKNNSI